MRVSNFIFERQKIEKFTIVSIFSALLTLLSLTGGGMYLYDNAIKSTVNILQYTVSNLSVIFNNIEDRRQLSVVLDNLEKAEGLGDTGEVLVASEADGFLNFLVAQRHTNSLSDLSVPRAAKLAEPMKRALSGESGWMKGLDYDGNRVLAAYTPVHGSELGIVAKIDLKEFLIPFLIALSVIGFVSIPLITISALWIIRSGRQVISELNQKKVSLELLLNNIPGVVYRSTITSPYKLKFVSDGVEAFLGLTRSAVLSKGVQFLDYIDEKQRVTDDIKHQLEQKKSYDTNYKIKFPDGSWRWIRDQGRIVISPEGSFIEGFIVDVHDVKSAMDQVVQSEHKYRALFDNADDCIFIMNGLEIVDCNAKAVDLFGTSINELIGHCVLSLSPVHQPAGILSASLVNDFVEEVMAKGVARFEWRYVTFNGNEFDAEVILSRLEILGDSHLLAISRDISNQQRLERETSVRKAVLNSLFESTVDAVFVKDLSGRYLYANKATCDLTGVDLKRIIGSYDSDIWSEEISRQISAQDKAILNSKKSSTFEESHPTDASRRLLTTKSVVVDDNGVEIGVCGIARDITEWKATNNKLSLLSKAMDQADNIVFVTDTSGVIEYANAAFERITGYSASESIGSSANILISDQHSPEFYEEFVNIISSGRSFSSIFINRRKSGELFHNHQTVTPVFAESGEIEHYLSVGKDLSEKLELEQKLHRAAFFDPLTRSPNRQLLCEQLQAQIDQIKDGHSVAFLVIDLYRFHRTNDRFGTEVGDRVLQMALERISSQVGQDSIVGRIGSDEFGVILPAAGTKSMTTRVVKRIQNSFLEPFDIDGLSVFSRTNVGVALTNESDQCAESILFSADSALTEVKNIEPGGYRFYSDDSRTRISRVLQIENGLREALKLGSFELVYQPKVNASTGVAVGSEALLRWRHPELGMVSPGEFVPIAEESGLIIEIGYWVIGEACRMASRLNALGLKVPIAINISPKQFDDPNLIGVILSSLKAENISADCLECEVTESTLISNAEVFNNNIQALKDIGIRLSIDDFGTGYSSLSYLKLLPVRVLKIDRSFVVDITRSSDDQALVKAIVAIADSLSMDVVVEGVEDSSQLDLLIKLGCIVVQGYYFSPGLPGDEFIKWVSSSS